MIGELRWAVKASLVSYVATQKGGVVEVSDGAENASGRFLFPLDERADPGGVLRFSGRVRLVAHEGLLDITLEAPWVSVGPEPTISVIVTTPETGSERLDLARLSLIPEDSYLWRGERVRLTLDGALTLGGLQYHEHQLIDDLEIRGTSEALRTSTAAVDDPLAAQKK